MSINNILSQVHLLSHIYVEGSILIVLLWILIKKAASPGKSNRAESNETDLEKKINAWNPQPLVSKRLTPSTSLANHVVESKVGKNVVLKGKSCINFATHNYYDFNNDKGIEKVIIDTVHKYGVGSCGPRAFYGTIDIHLELEERIAKFMCMEDAVLYSYGFSTVTSAIQAYIKSKDIVFVDEEVNFAIQQGLQPTKATVIYFKHNSPDDLERLIIENEKKGNMGKKNKPRKAFLIVEGIYINTGKICNLPRLIDIRIKHKIRIFIDETISIGILGAKGRGVTEHFNIPKNEVDLIIGSLETSLAAGGGFCVGSRFVINHQRLSGLGYCFSASAPPLLSAAAIQALDRIDKNPNMLMELRECSIKIHKTIANSSLMSYFTLRADEISPVKHLYLKDDFLMHIEQQECLQNIVNYCISKGVALIVASYLDYKERKTPKPSIRLLASTTVTDENINLLKTVLLDAAKTYIS
ncbi:serine palmitoyltransferase 1 [Daktulosphaira vitifoliae]|uniref:serine palmitoyltransferase 1 n=1 Tax=Daktulosphaira vitifoliae TaxID=58002 RepID=UPI0021A9E101|nr:serine palmitoyltransferase 1 [Daktulosphaira vitifoliae]